MGLKSNTTYTGTIVGHGEERGAYTQSEGTRSSQARNISGVRFGIALWAGMECSFKITSATMTGRRSMAPASLIRVSSTLI